jgi:hypothetical protein
MRRCSYKLYRQPGDYDVIVAPNMYGDILRCALPLYDRRRACLGPSA